MEREERGHLLLSLGMVAQCAIEKAVPSSMAPPRSPHSGKVERVGGGKEGGSGGGGQRENLIGVCR